MNRPYVFGLAAIALREENSPIFEDAIGNGVSRDQLNRAIAGVARVGTDIDEVIRRQYRFGRG